MPGGAAGARAAGARAALAPAAAGAGGSGERAAPAAPAARGTGKRRRGEADVGGAPAGGAAQKKPRSACPNNRQRSQCKECGGSAICQHQRQRSRCKECGGSAICQHQRRRSTCKECGGSAICQHQRLKSRCKECGTEAHASISDRPGRVPISERQEDGSAAQSAVRPKVEEVDGSYACLICSESVRGQDARSCSQCTCQPWHTECAQPALSSCPQCARSSVVPFQSGGGKVSGLPNI
jgi:hypothetical protein